MHARHPDPDHPDPERLEYEELRAELSTLLGYHNAPSALEGHREPLPRRWLVSALQRARRCHGHDAHVATGALSDRELLVATLHWLGADVEAVVSSEDPRDEVEAVYCGVLAMEKRAAAVERANAEEVQWGPSRSVS